MYTYSKPLPMTPNSYVHKSKPRYYINAFFLTQLAVLYLHCAELADFNAKREDPVTIFVPKLASLCAILSVC